MKNKTLAVFAALAAAALLPAAHAGCYTVYNKAGAKVYQSPRAPVDTQQNYSESVTARFGAGAHLVYTGYDREFDAQCLPIGDATTSAQSGYKSLADSVVQSDKPAEKAEAKKAAKRSKKSTEQAAAEPAGQPAAAKQ